MFTLRRCPAPFYCPSNKCETNNVEPLTKKIKVITTCLCLCHFPDLGTGLGIVRRVSVLFDKKGLVPRGVNLNIPYPSPVQQPKNNSAEINPVTLDQGFSVSWRNISLFHPRSLKYSKRTHWEFYSIFALGPVLQMRRCYLGEINPAPFNPAQQHMRSLNSLSACSFPRHYHGKIWHLGTEISQQARSAAQPSQPGHLQSLSAA